MIIFITGLVVGTGYTVIKFYSKDLPDINKLKYYQPSESTKIYSADNKLIGTIFKENRTWVSFYKIPDVMKQAILAIEDSRFYTHNGVDFIGIGRAFVADIKHEEINQGASTITMELARNIFLTPRVTIERKIKEIILSFNIEKKFTKEDILEFYLNQIYFGSGAYGIESAASVYFDKKAKDLDLAEASMLAGLPAAPSLYSPYVNMELAKQRKKLVLDRMVQLGYVTPKQADEAFD